MNHYSQEEKEKIEEKRKSAGHFYSTGRNRWKFYDL